MGCITKSTGICKIVCKLLRVPTSPLPRLAGIVRNMTWNVAGIVSTYESSSKICWYRKVPGLAGIVSNMTWIVADIVSTMSPVQRFAGIVSTYESGPKIC